MKKMYRIYRVCCLLLLSMMVLQPLAARQQQTDDEGLAAEIRDAFVKQEALNQHYERTGEDNLKNYIIPIVIDRNGSVRVEEATYLKQIGTQKLLTDEQWAGINKDLINYNEKTAGKPDISMYTFLLADWSLKVPRQLDERVGDESFERIELIGDNTDRSLEEKEKDIYGAIYNAVFKWKDFTIGKRSLAYVYYTRLGYMSPDQDTLLFRKVSSCMLDKDNWQEAELKGLERALSYGADFIDNGKRLSVAGIHDYIAESLKKEVADMIRNLTNIKTEKCDGNPYYLQHTLAVSGADGTTNLGEKVVLNLNEAIRINKTRNRFGDDPMKANLDGLQYITAASAYDIGPVFQNSLMADINDKMAYLEIVKGYQFYIHFVPVTCPYDQKQVNDFAQEVFNNSKIDKDRGILVLVTYYTGRDIKELKAYRVGVAMGSGVREASKMKEDIDPAFDHTRNINDLAVNIINAYKHIPKKKYVIEYYISKVSQSNNNLWREGTIYKSPGVWLPREEPGNVIESNFFLYERTNGVFGAPQGVQKILRLKERYVLAESNSYARMVGKKMGNWQFKTLVFITTNVSSNGGYITEKDLTKEIDGCKFEWSGECESVVDRIVDIGLIVTGVPLSFIGMDWITDGIGTVYFASRGKWEQARVYSACMVLPFVASPLVEGSRLMVTGLRLEMSSAWKLIDRKLISLVIKPELNIAKETIENLLKSNGAEYLIPHELYASIFAKISEDGKVVYGVVVPNGADGAVMEIWAVAENKRWIGAGGKTATEKEIIEHFEEALAKGIADDIPTILGRLTGKLNRTEYAAFEKCFGGDINLLHRFDTEDELLEAWRGLHNAGRDKLKKEIGSVEKLMEVRRNSENLTHFGITDDMLVNLRGSIDHSYVDALEELNKAVNNLPKGEGQVEKFSEVIRSGNNRGLTAPDPASFDPLHSYVILKKINENAALISQADKVIFETKLTAMAGVENAVPDVLIRVNNGSRKIIFEIKTGEGITKNFNTQCRRYFYELASIGDLRIYSQVSNKIDKAEVIAAWKRGGLLEDTRIRGMFSDFIEERGMTYQITNKDTFEQFLKADNDWYNLIFNSNFTR
ncbi:TPM domain-containing protein [Chitinophaga sp. Mgbs1]|uniref:TPM domain-containing protein n=1 Tax=Chitinophaga solisilvae TaxID=1233460 RepID=A0A9Q5GRS4_9BACT|nr:TPM domain-containing protein [Chitinophaga solisilvae]